jgi:predicted RNA methylase
MNLNFTASTRDRWSREPGNPYASDSTYEVAVTLSSNKRCWDLVEPLRGEDGKVDPEQLKALFEAKLSRYNMTSIQLTQIDWSEVASEFATEEAVDVAVDLQAAAGAPAPADGQLAAGTVDLDSLRIGDQSGERGADSDEEETSFAQLAAERARPIAAPALEVLRRCTATEVGVFLPSGQLERKLYEAVNEVLEALGGKWNRSKKCHQFKDDPRAVLQVALATGSFITPQDFGYFPTPEAIARKVVEAADIRPGMVVLEPSAGRGALAKVAGEIVGVENVHTVEMLPDNRAVLQEAGFNLFGEDFLAMTPRPMYDRIVMNPPFERLADIAHVEHAARFLRPDGVLVAITSPGWQFREQKKPKAFRELMERAGDVVEELEAGAFRQSGTDVRTVILRLEAARMPWLHREQAVNDAELDDDADDTPTERMRA